MSRLLARGREILRERLRGRGVALPAGGLVALAAGHACAAGQAAAVPERVVEIADAVLAELAWQPLKIASAVVLAAGLLAFGLVAAQPRADAPPAAAVSNSPKEEAVPGA